MSISPVSQASNANTGAAVAPEPQNINMIQLMQQQMELIKEVKECQTKLSNQLKTLDKRLATMEKTSEAHSGSIEELNDNLSKLTVPKEKTTKDVIMETARDVVTIGGVAITVMSLGSLIAGIAGAIWVAPTISEFVGRISVTTPPGGPCPSLDRINAWQAAMERYAASAANRDIIMAELLKKPETNAELIKQFADSISSL